MRKKYPFWNKELLKSLIRGFNLWFEKHFKYFKFPNQVEKSYRSIILNRCLSMCRKHIDKYNPAKGKPSGFFGQVVLSHLVYERDKLTDFDYRSKIFGIIIQHNRNKKLSLLLNDAESTT